MFTAYTAAVGNTRAMNWYLIAAKRRWVPEWLWSLLGQAPRWQPLRWLTTTSVTHVQNGVTGA